MNAEEKKSPEYLEGFFDGTQKMREIFEKCADDADKLNYDRGHRDAELELALTTKDVRMILMYADVIALKFKDADECDETMQERYYEEILRKFNEYRNKQSC